MLNETVFKRIIKLLALTVAIPEERMWQEYLKYGSIDKIVSMIENKEIV